MQTDVPSVAAGAGWRRSASARACPVVDHHLRASRQNGLRPATITGRPAPASSLRTLEASAVKACAA